MTGKSRIQLGLASLLLLLVYVLPLWLIKLEAPQYPEGIGMRIWVNTITGEKPQDLQNINGLNHYIGMKKIEPDSIAELKIMPWLFGGLILFGLIGAASGNRWLLLAWVAAFVIATVVGLVDFYLWEYDYGHNLAPEAAIKIPGMSYQPPLIGSKKLLNFTATSWPGLGGWAAFASLLIGLVTVYGEFFGRNSTKRRRAVSQPAMQTAVAALMLLVAGCATGPQPIRHGHDACAYCKMLIVEEQYGAELVTGKGKIYKFDSVECLASHLIEGQTDNANVASLWTVDFENPPELVAVDDAFFLHSKDLRSPMGMYLTAFGPGITAQAVQHSFYGNVLDWEQVLGIVANKTLPPGANAPPAARASH